MIIVSQVVPSSMKIKPKDKERVYGSELFQRVLNNEIKKLQEKDNYK